MSLTQYFTRMTLQPTTAYVPAPVLDMRDEGTPISSQFGDVYFSRAGGVAETEHVFLHGNQLLDRWRAMSSSDAFTVAELGFGTGLNFLVTLTQFRATAPAGGRLHYIAIEKFPFTPEVLRALLNQQPELIAEAEELLGRYPLRLPGIHRIHFGTVSLTLCIGDVAEMLPQIATTVDAWFLDGFSPAKNPDMWGEVLFKNMQRLSGRGTTVATFTAASHVRRGLVTAGFGVRKVAGFGRKREMSVGVYEGSPPPALLKAATTAIVVGAGIAGAILARALAERGVSVTVLERGRLAGGASGNAAGVLFPQISKRWNDASAWYFTAYGYMLRELSRWQQAELTFDHAPCGMLRLPRHAEEEELLRNLASTHGIDPAIVLWMAREEAAARVGVPLATGGAYFPHGTWLNPQQLCAALLQHTNIRVHENTPATGLKREVTHWCVSLENGEVLRADACCITAAHESAAWLGEYGIRLNAVGGQVSLFDASAASAPLQTIVCHSGYIIPARAQVVVGATYHRDDMLAVTESRHHENRAALEAVLPGWMKGEPVAGRCSIRATTPDRLPYIGQVEEGLYVSTGHGSRGLLSAPLGAEIIASHMLGEMPPVTQALLKKVNPRRFIKQ